MRNARAGDYKRRLLAEQGKFSIRLLRFSFSGIPSLGEGELPFASSFTVLCGPNGVGKTTLLRALGAAARPDAQSLGAIAAHKLPSGRARLEYTHSGQDCASEVTFVAGQADGGSPISIEVVHLDAAFELPKEQEHFCSFGNVADLINGVGVKTLDDNQLREVNYLANRDYREVRFFEVEGVGAETVPYFEVSYEDSRYDSRAMGAGEFAILYLWWAFQRATKDAMILVEEPECHISPTSQRALCNFITSIAAERHLTVIMTSHSSDIISSMSDENLAFVYRERDGIKIVGSPAPPVLLENIGVKPTVSTVVLVEDESGFEFGRFLLETFRPDLSRRIEFAVREGAGGIVSCLTSTADFRSFKLVGLFDGDQEGSVPERLAGRFAFLPGKHAIEKDIKAAIEADFPAAKAALGREDLGAILSTLGGADPHEWFGKLCHHLGLTKKQVLPLVFRLWLRHGTNEAAGRKCVEMLTALL